VMEQPNENGKGAMHRSYVVRKLCSNIEEYEASPCERMNIDLSCLENELTSTGLTDVFVKGPQLTVLMEDIDTTAKIYPSGVIHLQANNKLDCEKACEIIYPILLRIHRSDIK
jgi:hypothetical protein